MKFFNGTFAFIAILVTIIFYILPKIDGSIASEPYFLGIVFVVAYLVIWGYCIPMLIAKNRQHSQFMPIAILNIAGGWSGILWLAALIWAVYNQDSES